MESLIPGGGKFSGAVVQHAAASPPAQVLLCFGLQLVAGQPAMADNDWAFSLIRRRVVTVLLLRCMLGLWKSGSRIHPACSCFASKAEAAGSIGRSRPLIPAPPRI